MNTEMMRRVMTVNTLPPSAYYVYYTNMNIVIMVRIRDVILSCDAPLWIRLDKSVTWGKTCQTTFSFHIKVTGQRC